MQQEGLVHLLDYTHYRFLNKNLPRLLLLQYNPFSWGKRGYHPLLIKTLTKIKYRFGVRSLGSAGITLGVMFHETYVPANTTKFKAMRLWQVPQYRRLADLADYRFFSVEKWAVRERERSPSRPTNETVHLPVGSNLPLCQTDRSKTRSSLGLDDSALVCGVFGTAHPARLLSWIAEAVKCLRTQGHNAVLLYIGPDGASFQKLCGDVPVYDQGRLPAVEAASCFPVMDMYLAPFADGLTTRRGSVMAALQHRIPVISNNGKLTDSVWHTTPGVILSKDNQADFVKTVLNVDHASIQMPETGFWSWGNIAKKLLQTIST